MRATVRFLNAAASLVMVYLLTVSVLLLPAGLVRSGNSTFLGFAGSRFDPARYWRALSLQLQHLIPPDGVHQRFDPTLLGVQAQVTLTILAGGVCLTLLLGGIAGYLLSRCGPSWLRRPVWGVTTLLLSLPDVLMIILLQILFYQVGRVTGLQLPVYAGVLGELSWRHFILPVIGLALLGVPYTARIVAAAMEDVAPQPYVQAARARGLSQWTVLWRYLGRNALVRAWGGLPPILGLLLSAAPVVEYMTEMPGLGRQLIRIPYGYGAALTLLPLVLTMMLLLLLIEAGAGRINPAQADANLAAPATVGSDGGSARRALRELAAWAADLLRGSLTLPARVLRALRFDPLLLAGTLLVGGLALAALLAPHLAPYPWEERELIRIDGSEISVPPFRPSERNWLGTDAFGRDVLSRLLWGTRFALLFALLAVPLRFLLALPLGMAAAYRGGWLAALVQRLATLFTSLPAVLLPLLAEGIRLLFRESLSRPFIEGARAAGAGGTRVLLRHVLPHALPSLAAMAALEVPVIMTVTTFLGLQETYIGGAMWDPETRRIVGPYMPEWGAMVTSPFQLFADNKWWLWLPFAALFVAVLAFTLLGEGLRRRAQIQ